MTIKNAIKKLEKAGFTVEHNHGYHATKQGCGEVIDFHQNGREDYVTCIRVRAAWDKDEIQTDYCAGVFVDNISQAIRIADRQVA
jgi:Fe2+ or Zn2+ uptake regulation protein